MGKSRVHISVENPTHVSRGIVLLTLDGAACASSLIDVDPEVAANHEVRVVLGNTSRSNAVAADAYL